MFQQQWHSRGSALNQKGSRFVLQMLLGLLRTIAGIWQMMSAEQKEASRREGGSLLHYLQPLASRALHVAIHDRVIGGDELKAEQDTSTHATAHEGRWSDKTGVSGTRAGRGGLCMAGQNAEGGEATGHVRAGTGEERVCAQGKDRAESMNGSASMQPPGVSVGVVESGAPAKADKGGDKARAKRSFMHACVAEPGAGVGSLHPRQEDGGCRHTAVDVMDWPGASTEEMRSMHDGVGISRACASPGDLMALRPLQVGATQGWQGRGAPADADMHVTGCAVGAVRSTWRQRRDALSVEAATLVHLLEGNRCSDVAMHGP
jgi:hypothetical protein